MNLFEINDSIRCALNAIFEEAEENEGIVSNELAEVLDVLNNTRDEKFESISLYIKELKTESEALKEEAKKLSDRARAAENHAERLKQYLSNGLSEAGVEKFKTTRVSLSFRNSSSVVIDDLEQIPTEYLRIKKEADKTAIKDAFAKGWAPAGTHIEVNKSLIIK